MAGLPDYSFKRFLIVYDQAFMLGHLERLLKLCKTGHIVKANDGGTALRAIEDEPNQCDCVITDFDMKPLNGLQLLSAMRLGTNPGTPHEQRLIMLTGNSDAAVIDGARALDVDGFIAKPVKPETLFPVINQALNSPSQVRPAAFYRAITMPAFALP